MRFRKPIHSSAPRKWTVEDLSAFYVQHRVGLVAHASRVLRDSSRAEEVVQDSFIKVILAAPELKSEDHALAYLHRSVENSCIDVVRLEGRRPSLVLLDDAALEIESARLESMNLEESLIEVEDAAIIRQALAMLSPAERAALIMWELEGRSAQEIANELGIKQSAVRHTVSRARSSLRKVLSNVVIDEHRGLTALDLLSKSYRAAGESTRELKKVTLATLLLLIGFIGFSSNGNEPAIPTYEREQKEKFLTDSLGIEPSSYSYAQALGSNTNSADYETVDISIDSEDLGLTFLGLNGSGVPTGFTVADFSGALGEALFMNRIAVSTPSESKSSQVLKTKSVASNILIAQTLGPVETGLSYEASVSFGRDGEWIPLSVRVAATDFKRQKDGNYLYIAILDVQSEVETPLKIAASAGGRDLFEAPSRLVTRILLDSSKLQVLAQAVLVLEAGTDA